MHFTVESASYISKDELDIVSVKSGKMVFRSTTSEIIQSKWHKSKDELLILSNDGDVEKSGITYQKVKISKFFLDHGKFTNALSEYDDPIIFEVDAGIIDIAPSLKWIVSSSTSPCNRGSQGGSCDGVFYLWDTETGAKVRSLFGHTSSPTVVAWNRNGNMFASGVSDNSQGLIDYRVVLWKPKKFWNIGWYNMELIGGEYFQQNFPKDINGLVVDARWTEDINRISIGVSDGTSAISAGQEDDISVIELNLVKNKWDMKGWDLSSSVSSKKINSNAPSINLKERLPRQVSMDKHLELFWFNKGQATPFKSKDEVLADEFEKAQQILVLEGTSNIRPEVVIIRNIKTDDEIILSGHGGFVTSAEWSPDNSKVLTAATDGTVRIWDVKTGIEKARYEGVESESFGTIRATWSPDGKWIMVKGTSVRIWAADVNVLLERANELIKALPDPDYKSKGNFSKDIANFIDEKKRLNNAYYNLLIEVNPKNAEITINGKPYDAKIKRKIGEYQIKVAAEAYQSTERVVTLGTQDKQVNVNLTPKYIDSEPEMVSILAGQFLMGHLGKSHYPYGRPVHKVDIKAFHMGKYEITVAQYMACVDDGVCPQPEWKDEREYERLYYGELGEGLTSWNYPIVGVSWDNAQTYASWLSKKTSKAYRLPSESEWEYASRAGKKTAFSWGNTLGKSKANCNEDCKDEYEYTSPVGSFPANSFGLFDMHGNVSEWVQDVWHKNYKGAPISGEAWNFPDKADAEHVIRGGDWLDGARDLTSAYRMSYESSFSNKNVGFRLALDREL